jgi:hypothetical protein
VVKSASDWRLRGKLVSATTSQAMALTMASSWGGKLGLAAASRFVVEGEIAIGPAFPPEPDGVGMESDASGGLGVGQERLVVKEQGQFGPLPQLISDGTTVDQGSGLGQELGWEFRRVSG